MGSLWHEAPLNLWRGSRTERKKSGIHSSRQEHSPKDKRPLHQLYFLQEVPAAKKCHRLGTKPLTHGSWGHYRSKLHSLFATESSCSLISRAEDHCQSKFLTTWDSPASPNLDSEVSYYLWSLWGKNHNNLRFWPSRPPQGTCESCSNKTHQIAC